MFEIKHAFLREWLISDQGLKKREWETSHSLEDLQEYRQAWQWLALAFCFNTDPGNQASKTKWFL